MKQNKKIVIMVFSILNTLYKNKFLCFYLICIIIIDQNNISAETYFVQKHLNKKIFLLIHI